MIIHLAYIMLSPFLWVAVYIASFLNKKIRLRMNSYKFLLKDSIVKAKQTNKEILVFHAAWMKDQGHDIKKEAAMAKLFASETAMKVTTEAIQIHGGNGYVKEYDVERYFRDAKILEIGEGTSEIQRLIISREILKLY